MPIRLGYCLSKQTGDLVASDTVVPVCLEQLGGLYTARSYADITIGSGQDVLAGRSNIFTRDGTDVTQEFNKGAQGGQNSPAIQCPKGRVESMEPLLWLWPNLPRWQSGCRRWRDRGSPEAGENTHSIPVTKLIRERCERSLGTYC